MRELEILLSTYLEHAYSTAEVAEQAHFQALLQLPEEQLQRLLLGGIADPNSAVNILVGKILRYPPDYP